MLTGTSAGRPAPYDESVPERWLAHASFRGFADYMATPAFGAGLAELEERACHQTTVIMCAEALRLSLPPFLDCRCGSPSQAGTCTTS